MSDYTPYTFCHNIWVFKLKPNIFTITRVQTDEHDLP